MLMGSGLGRSAFGGAASNAEGSPDQTQSDDLRLSLVWLLAATVVGTVLGTLSPVFTKGVLELRGFCQGGSSTGQSISRCGFVGLIAGLIGCAVYGLTGCQGAWGVGQLSADPVELCGPDSPLGDAAHIEVWVVLLLGLGKLLSFGVCFATGGAGGVLMPTLVVGSLLGWCVGSALAPLDTRLRQAGSILGMAAFFGANMRLPLTAAGVVLEYTGYSAETYNFQWACAVPLASALGTWVAAWWNPIPISEQMMMQDGIDPFTLSQQIQVMLHGSETTEVQVPAPVGILSRRSSIASSRNSILSASMSGIPNTSTKVVIAAKRRSLVTPFPSQGSTSMMSRPSNPSVSSERPSMQDDPLSSWPPHAVAVNALYVSNSAGISHASFVGDLSVEADRGWNSTPCNSAVAGNMSACGASEGGAGRRQFGSVFSFACRGSVMSRTSSFPSHVPRQGVSDTSPRQSDLGAGLAPLMPRMLGRTHALQRDELHKRTPTAVVPSAPPTGAWRNLTGSVQLPEDEQSCKRPASLLS